MTIATTERLTIQAYLSYADGADDRYELVDGELVRMPQGTGQHGDITEFLNDAFKLAIKQNQVPWVSKEMRTAIQSPRGGRWETARVPDIIVLPTAQWNRYKNREAFIPLNEPPPILVVEVVSPSTIAIDYREKYREYEALNIAEYWIVDPIEAKITLCTLRDGAYHDRVLINEDLIDSPTLGELNLTVAEVLAAEI